MSNIEKIRQEIERRKGYISVTHFAEELLSFIDSLPEESENHGCGVEFPHFGANYPDAKRIDGYLWDMDSYENGIYTIGGDDPCPICNTEKWLKDVLDDEIFKTRDEALEYVRMLKSKYKHKDSLPDENNPEPYNPVYDEDYLNEKIAKATKSWEGVDVNKMLADCRGYEEKPSENLKEEVKRYYSDNFTYISSDQPTLSILTNVARHFAEWQYQKDRGEFAKLKAKEWSDGYNEGIAKGKEQMLKDVVEVDVDDLNGEIYNNCIEKGMTGEDKVRIFIVKED